jgi:uncharacterized membrane protein
MSKHFFRKFVQTLVLCALPTLAGAQTATDFDFGSYNLHHWGIREFHSDIQINQDSSIDITERIVADFTQASDRRGIIRYVPIKYQDRYQQNLDLRFTLKSVSDENGQPYETSVTWPGDSVNIRIGSPDVYVDGQLKTYVIKYHLERGLNRFEDHDELYWNVNGNGWDTAILSTSATVRLPTAANPDELKAICYSGLGYSTEQDCQAVVTDGTTYNFSSNSFLPPYAGLTIAVSFPKDLVNFPDTLTYLSWFLQDNWGYLIPLLVFFYLYYQWYRHGRDPEATRSTVMPQYESPDNLRPAEIGTLIDDKVDMPDITSTIIDLATRGYLKIIEEKKKGLLWGESTSYTLEKTTPDQTKNSDPPPLEEFERKIYDAVFDGEESISLDSLKYKFYKKIPGIKTAVYESLVKKKYYASSPEKARESYMGCGGALAAVTFFFLGFLIEYSLSIFLGLIISGVIIFIFGIYMPKKTQLGADTRIKVLGLEEFLKTAEQDRMKFYEDQNIFEKMLPYAIALGLAEKWAKACEGLAKEQPEWYQSSDQKLRGTFNSLYFLNTLNSFNNTISSNMTSAPRSSASGGSSGFSSGDGFSGGGFGGGGGSSW